MFSPKICIEAYTEIQNDVSGADFEKQWFESAMAVLNKIQAGLYNPVQVHVKLLEIRDGFAWIRDNLNEALDLQYRSTLRQVYGINIQILNSAIESQNMALLSHVITTIKAILNPYYQTRQVQ